MYTFSGTPTTVATIIRRAGDHDEEDVALMHSEFAFLENIRMRGRYTPAAGAGTNLQLIIEFIGVSAASGIIGQLAVNLFGKITKALLALYHHRTDAFPLLHFDDVILKYDDVTVTINYLNSEVIEQLPTIMEEVRQLMEQLTESPPHEIQLPIYFDGNDFDAWNKNSAHAYPKTPSRYWLLRVYDASGPSMRFYDHKNKAVITIDYLRMNQITKSIVKMEADETEQFLEILLSNPDNYSS
jgi:hypothetical protein